MPEAVGTVPAPQATTTQSQPFQRGKLRPGAPKRIIFVSVDTLAANHLSTYGYQRRTSPALTAFARESILFENAIAPAPWTFPSYASQFTSRHSDSVMNEGMRIPESEHLLAEYMRRAGYHTAGFVDNEYLHPPHGMSQGYDYYRAHENSSGRSLQEALRWLQTHKTQPLFLFVHTNDVHGPYLPRAPFTQFFDRDAFWGPPQMLKVLDSFQAHVFGALPRYQLLGNRRNADFYGARYDAAIRQTDLWFEHLLNELRALDGWEDTVVIFSSDHGESFGNHDFYMNHGLLYEDIIRVPLLVRLPHGEGGGTRIDSQVSLVDLLPTLLELTGERPRGTLSGRSMLPVMRGERAVQSEHVFASQGIFEQFMVRTDRFKLVRMIPGTAHQDLAWHTFPRIPRPGRHEVIHELYDLSADPEEKHNLARRMPRKVAELRQVLERWRTDRPEFENEAFELSDAHKDRLRALGYIE